MKTRVAILTLSVAVVAGACAGLGMWQLARLHARRSYNTELLGRSRRPVATLAELGGLRGGRDDPAAYRRVAVTGTFDAAREIVLRARTSADGRGGNHVLTPLVLGGRDAILVDRGWVPLPMDTPPLNGAAPPRGTVSVTGVLAPSEEKPRFFGPHDPPSGTLSSIGRIDLPRIAKQLPYRLEPLYVAEQSQSPPAGDLPVAAGLPAPGEGPHLSYAIQWFLFAAVALVTGVLLIRRERTPAHAREATRVPA